MLQTKYKIQSWLLSSLDKNINESLNCFYTLQIINYAMLIYIRGVCFVRKHSAKMTEAGIQTKSVRKSGWDLYTSEFKLLTDFVEIDIDKINSKYTNTVTNEKKKKGKTSLCN